jgi:hypothetical protein
MRIERAARLTAAGVFTDGEIARQIGITPVTLSVLKQTSEFKTRMIEHQTGIISENDLEIRQSLEYQQEELKEMVPMALQRLKTLMLSKNDRVALSATQEVLDRQGDHAKVSRSSVTIEDKTDTTAADAVATDILGILRGQPETKTPNITETMTEFTRGAMDSDSQVTLMADEINKDTLEDIDAAKLGRPQ